MAREDDQQAPQDFRLFHRRQPAWAQWLIAHLWAPVVVGVLAIAAGVVIYKLAPAGNKGYRPNDSVFASILFWVIGGMFVLLPLSIWSDQQRLRRDPDAQADELAQALKTAVRVIESTRQEVEQGQLELQELTERVQRHRELAKLSAPEQTAVAALVQEELGKAGRRSLMQSFLLNCLFFALGIGATLLVSHL